MENPPFQHLQDSGVVFLFARGTPAWTALVPMLSAASAMLHLVLGPAYFLYLSGTLLAVSVLVLAFFRDPERRIGEGVVSPADGVVTRAEVKRGRAVVSVFMNIHNVHVNRSPWDLLVISMEHVPGGFVPAFDKDSDTNERLIYELASENGKWRMVQIAGAVARRIVPYVSEGDRLAKGQRFGLIRFGSRVDLDFKIPARCRLKVRTGDRVKAGVTTLAG